MKNTLIDFNFFFNNIAASLKKLSLDIMISLVCLLLSMYHRQQEQCYPICVYLPISKLHTILAVANLLAHNNS